MITSKLIGRSGTTDCSVQSSQMIEKNSCVGCRSTLHMSSFCPTVVYDSTCTSPTSSASAVGYGPVNRLNNNFTQSGGRHHASTYILGRLRTMYNGKEIHVCNNFNTSRGCNARACRNAHICLTCKQMDHAKMNCSSLR